MEIPNFSWDVVSDEKLGRPKENCFKGFSWKSGQLPSLHGCIIFEKLEVSDDNLGVSVEMDMGISEERGSQYFNDDDFWS